MACNYRCFFWHEMFIHLGKCLVLFQGFASWFTCMCFVGFSWAFGLAYPKHVSIFYLVLNHNYYRWCMVSNIFILTPSWEDNKIVQFDEHIFLNRVAEPPTRYSQEVQVDQTKCPLVGSGIFSPWMIQSRPATLFGRLDFQGVHISLLFVARWAPSPVVKWSYNSYK